MEAIAASRLGRLYDKVLRMKLRAKDYFKYSMELAGSMEPRNFSGESKQALQFDAETEACYDTSNSCNKSKAYIVPA